MFKFIAALAVAATVLVVGLTATSKPTEAQTPFCAFPVNPYSTVCAPFETVRILCPGQFNNLFAAQQSLYFPGYSAFNPYFVSYYGYQVPVLNGLYYNYQVPMLVTIDSLGNVTNVQALPDSRICAPAVPTPVPTPVVVEKVVERVVQVPVQVAAPAKAGILPPKTGDAGLLVGDIN